MWFIKGIKIYLKVVIVLVKILIFIKYEMLFVNKIIVVMVKLIVVLLRLGCIKISKIIVNNIINWVFNLWIWVILKCVFCWEIIDVK